MKGSASSQEYIKERRKKGTRLKKVKAGGRQRTKSRRDLPVRV